MTTTGIESRLRRLLNGALTIRWSLILSLAAIFFDVVLSGGYVISALICPIMVFVALVRAAVGRASTSVTVARLLIPIVTGLLVFGNYILQGKIAMANAAQIIQACERYRETNGAYPDKLRDLVPNYLSSIPKAKYCFSQNEFVYHQFPPNPILWWVQVPPFGDKVYNFRTHEWDYLD